MSPSALRYQPRPDHNAQLRQRIVELAQRHRRYGAPMIYLKLRQAGLVVNHKRVERLYQREKLQVRRRRRKKIPLAERQSLIRPGQPNKVWSLDFVFDRVAGGRTIKCLVIVDDATHESVAIVPEYSIGGNHLTRILDEICSRRGRPAVIRTDNGPEFIGKRAKTEEVTGRADAGPLCKAVGREGPYNHGWALDQPATECGGTSGATAYGVSRPLAVRCR